MSAHPRNRRRRSDWLLVSLSLAVLLVCLSYTLAHAFLAPHPGITTNDRWGVILVDPCDAHPGWCEGQPVGLQIGDELLAVGDLTYEEYTSDRRHVPFGGFGPGERVPITLRRDGRMQTIQWLMPIPSRADQAQRLISPLFYLPFWAAGTIVLLFLRPRDQRWGLLVTFDYLIAIWLSVGAVSNTHMAASSLVIHALTWPLIPVCLHLHLLVPTPLLRRRSHYLLGAAYAVAAVVAALELFQLLPSSMAYLALSLALLASLGLLLYRWFDRSSPQARASAGLMLAGIATGIAPGLVVVLASSLLDPSGPGVLGISVALVAVPVVPLSYTYAIYKRYLGALEFRANLLLSVYSFILLCGTFFVLAFLAGGQWLNLPGASLAFSLVVSLVFVVAISTLRTRFQRLVDRLAYGTEYDSDDVVRAFANQIPAALNREALAQLLAEKVTPSLLIRQSALCLLTDQEVELVYAKRIPVGDIPKAVQEAQTLLTEAGQYRPTVPEATEAPDTDADRREFDWVRLAIPLELGGKTTGVWLFGRRDPDDYYPQDDITLLTTLASQVAVALENTQLYGQAQREIAERKQAEESLRQRNRELALLNRASRAFIATLELDQVLATVLEEVRRLLNVTACSIWLIDLQNPKELVCQQAAGSESETVRGWRLAVGEGLAGWVARSGEAVVVPDTMADGRHSKTVDRTTGVPMRSILTVPLRVKQEVIGVIQVLDTAIDRFKPTDLALAELLASAAASAIENARLYEELVTSYEETDRLRAFNENIVQSMEEGILLEDVAGTLTFANRKAGELLGYAAEELVGLHWTATVPREYMERVAQESTKRVQGIASLYEAALLTQEGEQVPVLVSARPLYDEGLFSGVLSVFTDITDRKRAEEALKEERARLATRVADRTAELSLANAELARTARLKDEFLAAMSHELRTPLNAILGLSATMQEEVDGPINERQRRSLLNIQASGHRLLELINEILDIAKIEAGKLNLLIGPVPVGSACQASLRMVKQMAQKKRVQVSSDLDSRVKIIEADARRLKQILVNLLNNAVKFTPEGGEIGLDMVGDEEQETVHFTVWDTGIGISAENMERLFQPFVQLDSSLSRQHPGTGLGLALVRRLTELHGGGISLRSQLGAGSRFTVSLPWREPAPGFGLSPQLVATAPHPEGPKMGEGQDGLPPTGLSEPPPLLILLVDDREAEITTMTACLQAGDYRLAIARNGIEAIQRAQEEPPDLILMDVHMSEMDGLEATRCIRADLTPGVAAAPIILLTALDLPGDRGKCLQAGANACLNKPVGRKQLLAEIEAQLRGSQRATSSPGPGSGGGCAPA